MKSDDFTVFPCFFLKGKNRNPSFEEILVPVLHQKFAVLNQKFPVLNQEFAVRNGKIAVLNRKFAV